MTANSIEGWARDGGRFVGFARDYWVRDRATGADLGASLDIFHADDDVGVVLFYPRDRQGRIPVLPGAVELLRAEIRLAIDIVPRDRD